MPIFRKIDRTLDKAELVCAKADGTKYDFNHFALPLTFIKKIRNYEITLDEAIDDQTKLKTLINKLNNNYNPWISKTINEKNRVLESAKKCSDASDDIIGPFEEGIFPDKDNAFKTKEEVSEEEPEKTKLRMNQGILTMICLKIILILQYLVLW